MTSGPIILSREEPFAHGRYRRCYVHPDDPGRCIKVNHPDMRPDALRARARPWKRFRSLATFDHNVREYRFYRQYERFYGDDIWKHVPRCHGMADTDLGPGLIVDYVRGKNGGPAERLASHLKRGGSPEVDRAIEEFRSFLLDQRLLTHELRLQNLVIGYQTGTSEPRIFIIDAIGLSDWLPLAYYSKWLAHRKVLNKLRRFDDRIREMMAKSRDPHPGENRHAK